MTNTNPFDPFDRLLEQIKEATKSLSLNVVGWEILPGMDPHDQRRCVIAYEITEATFQSEEDRLTDQMIEEIEAEEARLRLEEETKKIVSSHLKIGKDGLWSEHPGAGEG